MLKRPSPQDSQHFRLLVAQPQGAPSCPSHPQHFPRKPSGPSSRAIWEHPAPSYPQVPRCSCLEHAPCLSAPLTPTEPLGGDLGTAPSKKPLPVLSLHLPLRLQRPLHLLHCHSHYTTPPRPYDCQAWGVVLLCLWLLAQRPTLRK